MLLRMHLDTGAQMRIALAGLDMASERCLIHMQSIVMLAAPSIPP